MIVKRFITQNKVVYFIMNQQKEIIQKQTKRLRKRDSTHFGILHRT